MKQAVTSFRSPQVLDDLVVQDTIGCNKASPDRHFVGKPDHVPLRSAHCPAGFGTDQHPGRGVGDPERSPEVDKPVNPPAADIAEFECGSAKEPPAPDLLAELHHAGGIEFSPVHAHGAFVEVADRRNADGFVIAPRKIPFFCREGFPARKVPHECLLDYPPSAYAMDRA